MTTSNLTARKLILATGSEIAFPVITVDPDGCITSIFSDPKALADETTTLTSGLLDIHMHGGVGVDVMCGAAADLHRLQRFLAASGTTHYLPTTVTAPVEFTLRALERLARLMEGPVAEEEAVPVGIHIEGPFLCNAKRGMHPAEHLQVPSPQLFEKLQTAANGHIRLMTIAPDADPSGSLTPSLELVRHATARGVRCSIGHTNANAMSTRATIDAGAVSATHTFNAMRPLDHREPGVLGTVLDETALYADLICDGVHVSPPLVRLWWRAKGRHRAILITDALAATGMPEGDYVLGDTPVSVRGERALVSADLAAGKETLAGSVLTLTRALQRFREYTGTDLQTAVHLASTNPATMMGAPEIVRLAPGDPATLNRYDQQGRYLHTYVRGRRIER
jgi:N-acetylglucosamine-6-phosphate deacetylase